MLLAGKVLLESCFSHPGDTKTALAQLLYGDTAWFDPVADRLRRAKPETRSLGVAPASRRRVPTRRGRITIGCARGRNL